MHLNTVRWMLYGMVALLLTSCGSRTHSPPSGDVTKESGITVLLSAGYAGNWPTGLDPATTTTGGANISIMNAVFDGLFQLVADDDGNHPRIIPSLAASADISPDGLTLVVHLRDNVQFSDGTSLTASAVLFNMKRDLIGPCSCSPALWPWRKQDPISMTDSHTVELHFTRAYAAAALNGFPTSNINWMVSPTALGMMGPAAFKLKPVGAGPFQVVTDQLSTQLVLDRNPHYWKPGRPFLNRLTFLSVGSEQSAYLALLSGSAHVVEGVSSSQLITQAEVEKRIVVTRQPGTSPYVIQLNTAAAPFNDKRAREAIYYATNVEAIRTGIFNGWYPASQSFTAPAGLFHHNKIPGYRTYDLARASSIVASLGHLRVRLGTVKKPVPEQIMRALQSQWQKAGMDVSIESNDIGAVVQRFNSGHWDAMLQTAGSYDPESGSGVSFRFQSNRAFSGIHDPVLDELLIQAADEGDLSKRDADYLSASRYISDNAYAPFLLAVAPTQFSVRGVSGPGLTTPIPPILVNTGILWQDVRFVKQ